MPGEVERLADLLDTDVAALFAAHLAVDWWEDLDGVGDVFVLSPALVGEEAGVEFPAAPGGRCVFYAEGRCTIHDAKPFECRALIHTDGRAAVSARHEATARAWVPHQDQIRDLLGREPEAEPPSERAWWL